MDVVDKILFDSGQTEIRPEGLGVLKRVVEILMTVTDKVIRVEGHTDSIPIGGASQRDIPRTGSFPRHGRSTSPGSWKRRESIPPCSRRLPLGNTSRLPKTTPLEGRARNRRIAIILLPKE